MVKERGGLWDPSDPLAVLMAKRCRSSCMECHPWESRSHSVLCYIVPNTPLWRDGHRKRWRLLTRNQDCPHRLRASCSFCWFLLSHHALLRGCSATQRSSQLQNRACVCRATCSILKHWNPQPTITFLGIYFSSWHFHCTSAMTSKFDNVKPNSEIRCPDWQCSGAAAAVFHMLALNELLQSIYSRKTHTQMQESRVPEPSIPHPSLPVQWALSQSSSRQPQQA